MARWISSKLKVAEDFLHQIDQQAADSLRKNENLRSDEELGLDASKKVSENKPLLKDQLKKKTIENNDLIRKIRSDHSPNVTDNRSVNNNFNNGNSFNKDKEGEVSLNLNPKLSAARLTDADWTELLSSPSKKAVPVGNRSGNGVSVVRVVRREGIPKGNVGLRSNVAALDGTRIQKRQTSVLKSERKSDVELEHKVNGGGLDRRLSDVGDAPLRTSTSSSGVELQNDEETVERSDFGHKDLNTKAVNENKNEGVKGRKEAPDGLANEEQLQAKNNSMDKYPPNTDLSTFNRKQELKMGLNDAKRSTIATDAVDGSRVGSQISASTKKSSSLPTDEKSDSETDSSLSDSECEHEREERRKRRQEILAEKAAAKATEAIKELENNVARLEGEKQSLEKILEERAKQQALEASKLQTTTMEIMEAVDLEKQKHNNTRMEALSRLAKLETANADLARSLASALKNLEVEISNVSNLHQQFELKEASLEGLLKDFVRVANLFLAYSNLFSLVELRRKISNTHQNSSKLTSKGVEFEHEILEADYSFLTDKVGNLQEKAKALETSIESTQRELWNPTEMELELKRRLSQLTDHLIQKQAQVEALSSEKATLLFKIEAVSRLLNESKSGLDSADIPSTSSRGDLESGAWELRNSNLKPLLVERIQSGKQRLGLLVRQLDSIYFAGAAFLRRNSTARTWSLVYLASLHLWVIYILMSHSPVSDEARSGAVISLENINNTAGV